MGFIDLDSVNREIDSFAESLIGQASARSSPQLADHTCFRPLYKPSRSYMIASYSMHRLTYVGTIYMQLYGKL